MPYGYRKAMHHTTPGHGAPEHVVPRGLAEIDRDLEVERAIWVMVRRAGADCSEARSAKAQLDRLLDEREEVVRAARLDVADHDTPGTPPPREALEPPPASFPTPPGSLSSW